MRRTLQLTAFLAIMTASAAAYAQPSSDDGETRGPPPSSSSSEEGERRGPPPEAFTACESQSQGDSCTVSAPHGDVSGTCEMPQGDKLVCAPTDKPSR